MDDHTPRERPRIEIGGVSYPLKFGNLAQLKASEWGLNTSNINLVAKDPARVLYVFMTLFAAGVAHVFHDARLPIPQPEDWAVRFQEAEWAAAVDVLSIELRQPDCWTPPDPRPDVGSGQITSLPRVN